MANFHFFNLTPSVRSRMLKELDHDIENSKLYISDRLTPMGKNNYADVFRNAIDGGDESTFTDSLRKYIKETEIKQGKSRKVPTNAATLLAQSEFNRYYIRAVCLEALATGRNNVEVYRARESSRARPESEAKIGSNLNADALLADLRSSTGSQPQILPEVNSGLSVKLD